MDFGQESRSPKPLVSAHRCINSQCQSGQETHNASLHSSAGEAPFSLMFGCDPFMPTLFKLLLPKLRYMGNEKCSIHLDTVPEIYMLAMLNLEMARDKCRAPIKDPSKTNFKIGDRVLL